MKKLTIALLGCLLTSNAFADCHKQKTVSLSTWMKYAGGNFNIWVSNKSDHNVHVSITLYRTDGSTYTEATEAGTNLVVSGAFTSSPLESEVTISPNNTGRLMFNALGNLEQGYGELTWTSDECLSKPLSVSTGYSTVRGHFNWYHVTEDEGI